VLKTGLSWEHLPQEAGWGSGVTCWRRLRDWQRAGVWSRLHARLLDWLGDADQIDWSRASLDSASVPAKQGGGKTGPNPTDRGKPGSKRHLVVDRRGIPLAVRLSAANAHDSLLFEPLIDAIPAILGPRGRPGRPRKRPAKLHADKGYDFPRCRRSLRRRGITARIARRGVDSSERLAIRYERRADIHEAFLHLTCSLVCLYYLPPGAGF
jgi:transposase